MSRQSSRLEVLLWSDGLVFGLMSILIVLPYLLFQASELFPIERVVSRPIHLLVVSAVLFVMFASVLSGRFLVNILLPNRGRGGIDPATRDSINLVVSSFLLISIFAHFLILPSVIGGYVEGGFVDAREGSFAGIGIPMRLYMFSLPVAFRIGIPSPRFIRLIYVLLVLIFARVVFLSERLAIFELILCAWFCCKAINYRPEFSKLLRGFFVVAFLFWGVQVLRLATIEYLDYSMVGVENTGVIQTVLTYYADVQNKFYEMMFFDYGYYFTSYDALLRKLRGVEISLEQGRDMIFFGDLFDNPKFISGLNNPGGLAQDYSDFGGVGFWIVFYLKFTLSAYFIYGAWRSLSCLALAPLFAIQILEYPRFNYLYLPFGIALLFVASFFSLYIFWVSFRR